MPTKRTKRKTRKATTARRSSRTAAPAVRSLPPVTNVPAASAGAVVQSFIDNGVQRIHVFPDEPETFTVQPE